jgi:membrane protein DedA with SNARE-associated domain
METFWVFAAILIGHVIMFVLGYYIGEANYIEGKNASDDYDSY